MNAHITRGGEDYTNGAFDLIVTTSKKLSDQEMISLRNYLESPTTADASVLKEALEKIALGTQGMDAESGFSRYAVEKAKNALAKYSTQSLPAPTANLVDHLRSANPYPEEKGFGAIDGWKFCCDKLEILLKQQS